MPYETQDAALRRLRDAFPRAGVSPSALVEAIATCDQDQTWRSEALQGLEVMPQDILDALALLSWARDGLDAAERRLVDAARERDLSWKDIAQATGLDSPQGAQRRRQRLARPVARRRS